MNRNTGNIYNRINKNGQEVSSVNITDRKDEAYYTSEQHLHASPELKRVALKAGRARAMSVHPDDKT